MKLRTRYLLQRGLPIHKRWLKRMLPSTLFARALLILILPVVLLQLFIAHVFYDRHWDSVVRNMSTAAAAEIAMLTDEYHDNLQRMSQPEALQVTVERGRQLGIKVQFRDDPSLVITNGEGRQKFPDFYDELRGHFSAPLMILPSTETQIHLRVNAVGGVFEYTLPRKRLASSTTYIFILWMVGSALLLTAIAILFLRNQVRPIVQLARAAEQFGLGQDVENFSPRGANEIRRAGRAFLVMADRIRRQVQTRTEMLAGISHDLRTPLTRMKLEIEMGNINQATRDALGADIEEMRRMIDEYLDFARGDAGEMAVPTDLTALVREQVAQYARAGETVTLDTAPPITVMLRPDAIRRACANLIDNALRYGGGVALLSIEQSLTFVRVKVADQGPGIPIQQHEDAFKPFTRLEPSRNAKTGGVGLGLSIARSVAQSHGGEITLENLRDAVGRVMGLEATLRLPQEVQALT